MKKTLLLTALLLMAHMLWAQESRRVLFIGNSYTEVNSLPAMVQRIAESCGARMEYQSNTPGGCTFAQHCSNQSMALIQQGNWDVVVLQEQSQLPSFPQSQVEQECFPYAQRLIDSVYAHSPNGEAMLYMTWGRKNGDQRNAQYFPVLGTYEGMDSMLYERYMYMARTYDASVCPVGRVWRYLRTHYREIELYDADESHPSLAGTYAAACAFYTMIFHQSPLRINYSPEIEEPHAQAIREAVQSVVYDTLTYWLRQPTDTIPNDTTHTDTAHTDTTHIDTTTVGITLPSDTFSQPSVQIYPNPATTYVTVKSTDGITNSILTIYDSQGRRVQRRRMDGNTATLQLTGLRAGVYTLIFNTANETQTLPLVIH